LVAASQLVVVWRVAMVVGGRKLGKYFIDMEKAGVYIDHRFGIYLDSRVGLITVANNNK
jgi:hypothetical protein